MDGQEAARLSLGLMESSEAVYLTTVDAEGFPQTRAMLNLRNISKYPELSGVFEKHNNDFLVYFTTNTSSPKVEQMKNNRKVCAYYCDAGLWRGLTLKGEIEIVSDDSVRHQLWQKEWSMYYSGGADDPDYLVLRLFPSSITGYHQMNHYTINPKRGDTWRN